MNKTAIVILTYNNLNYNKGCLDSIRKYTKEVTYEIVIVDNASTDGTREWLAEQKDIKVVLNSENVGFPKGCNIGIEAAEKDSDIMLLNNDVEVCPRWLENMQVALYSGEDIGAVGATTSYDFKGVLNSKGEVLDFDANPMEQVQEFASKNNILDSNRWMYRNSLIGFCMLIKRSVLNNVGNLDERFTPGTFEDDDISLRIVCAGYKLLTCYDSYIHHFGSKSFNHKTAKYWELIERNSKKFREKWGFNSNDKYHVRNDLLRMIEDSREREMNILQMGPGLGGTLISLKNSYPKANLYAIENYEKFIPIASGMAQVSTKKIGEFPLEFEEGFFDYIIIGNYLESVDTPKEFLIGLKKYLKKDGCVIGAIQNVMHYSVIRDLIGGLWKYAPENILSRNNNIFLTANDITKFFGECGYINPFIFHWYYVGNEEDGRYINKLCEIGGEDKEYLYRTYQFTVKFMNS